MDNPIDDILPPGVGGRAISPQEFSSIPDSAKKSAEAVAKIRSDLKRGVQLGWSPIGISPENPQTPTPSRVHLLREEDLKKAKANPKEYGWLETFGRAWKHETPMGSFLYNRPDSWYGHYSDWVHGLFSDYESNMAYHGPEGDSNFVVSEEMLQQAASRIPEEYIPYLLKTKSLEEFYYYLDHFRYVTQEQQKIRDAGGLTALTATLAANIVDPAYLAAGAVTFGAAGAAGITGAAAANTSRIGAAVRGGLLTGVSMAPVEAARVGYDPTWNLEDAALAMGTGMLGGGILSGIFPRMVYGRNWKQRRDWDKYWDKYYRKQGIRRGDFNREGVIDEQVEGLVLRELEPDVRNVTDWPIQPLPDSTPLAPSDIGLDRAVGKPLRAPVYVRPLPRPSTEDATPLARVGAEEPTAAPMLPGEIPTASSMKPWDNFKTQDGTILNMKGVIDAEGDRVYEILWKANTGEQRIFRVPIEQGDALLQRLEKASLGKHTETGLVGRDVPLLPADATPHANGMDFVPHSRTDPDTEVVFGGDPWERITMEGSDPLPMAETPEEFAAALRGEVPKPKAEKPPSIRRDPAWIKLDKEQKALRAERDAIPRKGKKNKAQRALLNARIKEIRDKKRALRAGEEVVTPPPKKDLKDSQEWQDLVSQEKDVVEQLKDPEWAEIKAKHEELKQQLRDLPKTPENKAQRRKLNQEKRELLARKNELQAQRKQQREDLRSIRQEKADLTSGTVPIKPKPPAEPPPERPWLDRPPEGVEPGSLDPGRRKMLAQAFWDSGVMGNLRTRVDYMRTAENPTIRITGNLMGESAHYKNTVSRIATEMAEIRAHEFYGQFVELRRKFIPITYGAGSFDAQMTRVGRSYRLGDTDHVEKTLIGGKSDIESFHAGIRDLMDHALEVLKKEGWLPPDFTPEKNWLPRFWLEQAISKFVYKVGGVSDRGLAVGKRRAARFLANAIDENWSRSLKLKVATHIVRIMTERGYRNFQYIRIGDSSTWQKMVNELRKSLGPDSTGAKGEKLTDEQVMGVAELLSPRPDMSPFKHARSRINLNHNYSEVINGTEYHIVDWMENNINTLMRKYSHRLFGFLEWSRMLMTMKNRIGPDLIKMGVPEDKVKFWTDQLNPEVMGVAEFKEWHRSIGHSVGLGEPLHLVHEESIDAMHRQLMGYSPWKSEHTTSNAVLNLFSDLAYIKSAGKFAFAQSVEFGHILGEDGLKAFADGIPFFRHFINKFRTGKFEEPEYLLDLIRETGVGDEARIAHDFNRANADEFYHAKFSFGLQKPMHLIQTVKAWVGRQPFGLVPIDHLQRTASLKGTIHNFLKLSHTVGPDGNIVAKKRWSKLTLKRLKDLGLSDDEVQLILREIRENVGTKVLHEGGKPILTMNLQDWDPYAKDIFTHAILRWNNRKIMRNRPGNLPPIMDHPMFRFGRQFTYFVTNYFNKGVRYGLRNLDEMTVKSWGYMLALGTMAYLAAEEIKIRSRRASGQYTNFEADMHRNSVLQWENLAREALRRHSASFFLPNLIDAISGELDLDWRVGPYESNIRREVTPPGISAGLDLVEGGSAAVRGASRGNVPQVLEGLREALMPNIPIIEDFVKEGIKRIR